MSADSSPPFVMEKFGRLQQMDRSFDIAYWQKLGSKAIFEEAWRMVVEAHLRKGGSPDELRLQRTVENIQRRTR